MGYHSLQLWSPAPHCFALRSLFIFVGVCWHLVASSTCQHINVYGARAALTRTFVFTTVVLHPSTVEGAKEQKDVYFLASLSFHPAE